MFVLVRAIVYATLFVGFVLVFLPTRLLSNSGIIQPEEIGATQITGMILTATGAAIALWCVLAFALIGRGTPVPFDPPRRLVTRGPYRFVRNPISMASDIHWKWVRLRSLNREPGSIAGTTFMNPFIKKLSEGHPKRRILPRR